MSESGPLNGAWQPCKMLLTTVNLSVESWNLLGVWHFRNMATELLRSLINCEIHSIHSFSQLASKLQGWPENSLYELWKPPTVRKLCRQNKQVAESMNQSSFESSPVSDSLFGDL